MPGRKRPVDVRNNRYLSGKPVLFCWTTPFQGMIIKNATSIGDLFFCPWLSGAGGHGRTRRKKYDRQHGWQKTPDCI
jgi:uncharacterized RDD family membrane protein YckC